MMLDLLTHLFSAVCGQTPDHTWAPGGSLLPVCQRCTGLYVGSAVAAALHLWLRPKLSGRFLAVHGAFLLLMVPFGYHWVPQGPVLRTVSGVLFGFGLLTFFRLPVAQANATGASFFWSFIREGSSARSSLYYAVSLLAACVAIPLLAAYGGGLVADVLSWTALGGALALAAFILANAGLAGMAIWGRCGKHLDQVFPRNRTGERP